MNDPETIVNDDEVVDSSNNILVALAQEVLASKHWRWIDGSQSIWRQPPERGGNTIRFRAAGSRPHNDHWFQSAAGGWELVGPALDDPATIGCLLALVRVAWNKPDLFVMRDGPVTFGVYDPGIDPALVAGSFGCHSEAAALVAALKAAP